MVKYQRSNKSTPYKSFNNTGQRTNLYQPTTPYHKRPYKIHPFPLRRGRDTYRPRRKYSASAPTMKYRRKTHETMRYAPPLPYKPQPTQRITPSSSQPWTEPTRSRPIQPIYKPNDTERLLKELEQRFDAELHNKVLELLEQESQEFFKTAIEQADEARQNPNTETREYLELDDKHPDNSEAEPTSDLETNPERADDALAQALFDAENALEWNEGNEQTESAFESPIASIEAQAPEPIEPIDNPESQPHDNAMPFTDPIDVSAELFAGIDDILDTIEPKDDIEASEPIEILEPEAYNKFRTAESFDIIEQALNEPAIESLLFPEMLLEPEEALELNDAMEAEAEAY